MIEWILEGLLLIGLFCMFVDDNRALWERPRSLGPTDDNHLEIPSGS